MYFEFFGVCSCHNISFVSKRPSAIYFIWPSLISRLLYPSSSWLVNHKSFDGKSLRYDQWWIQNFPGAPTSKGEGVNLLFGQYFPENCMNMKQIGPGEGGHASPTPPPPWKCQWGCRAIHLFLSINRQQADIPPRSRHPPEQTPILLRADTPPPPPRADTYGDIPTWADTLPEADTPPPGSRLRHTVNERPVRILLECILVILYCSNCDFLPLHFTWYPFGKDSESLPFFTHLANILTFEVVSNIMVDFSKIALATPICALCFSLFKSWNRKTHKELNKVSKCQDYEIYCIEPATISW